MLEYVLVAEIVEVIRQREGERGESAVPNTTDRSVVDHPRTFDLYLYEEGVGNGGEGGNYCVRIELDRTAPLLTDLKLCRLDATLAASGYAQVPGSE